MVNNDQVNESPEDKALYEEVYGKNDNQMIGGYGDGQSTMRVKWAFDNTVELKNTG